jgi:hypothetical protein
MRLSFASFAAYAIAITGLVGAVGCTSTQYRGAEPSARTFHEDPNPSDYYVGMDLLFTVDQDAPHVPAAHRMDADIR